jgi:Rrf2 family transcriptional regulator, iron-sulfur cluster assembly transcription factor
MKLSTKSRYAVMAIIDIALNSTGAPISLQQISTRQTIALSYLEQIFVGLRKNDIVISVKGPGGGYILGRGLSDIKIFDIVAAVSNSLKMARCSCGKGCMVRGNKCLTHGIWEGLEKSIASYLQSISLLDVINDFHQKDLNTANYNAFELK